MSIIIPIAASCSNNHLITDSDYRNIVNSSFNERKILAAGRAGELFSVFENHLSERQSEALKFLYAYMPLSDLADYDGEFFLANVNISCVLAMNRHGGKIFRKRYFSIMSFPAGSIMRILIHSG